MLAKDRAFWIAAALIGAAVFPYLVPVLDVDQLYEWGTWYTDVPLSAAALLAAIIGIGRVHALAERRFWRLVAVAWATLLAAESMAAFILAGAGTVAGGLAADSLYLAYYLLLFLAAAASRGRGESRGLWDLERLRGAGLGIVAFGLIVYFDGVPRSVDPDAFSQWYPGLYLFALLDVGLCVAFLTARRVQQDRRWRSILAGMAGVSALFAVLDAAEATLYLAAFVDIGLSPHWDLAWFLPQAAFVVIARRHLGDPRPSSTPPGPTYLPRTDRGLLVVGLLTLPVLHGLLYSIGVLDPALRDLREGVVLFVLLATGVVTLAYLRTLETERDRGSRKLKLSEERYRSFVHARSDGIYRAEAVGPVRLDWPFFMQATAAEQQLRIAEARDGVSASDPEAMIGAPLIDLLGPDRTAARALLRPWIEGGYQVEEFDLTRTGPDGEVRYVSGSLTGVVENGDLVRAWVTLSDVTEQRLAALATERLERELEHAQRMETVGTLAGGIAHDFNNLLVPIMGFTELAKITTPPDHEATRESLDRVLQASHRAADLVEQVLAISRSRPRNEEVFEAQGVAREALKLLRPSLPSTVEIGTSIDDGCPPMRGDPSRIHQVLMNLCTNAAQAIGDSRGRLHVSVQYDRASDEDDAPHGWIVLEVSDDGPGIQPKLLERVFDPFFTTKPPGEGTGLGLAVVHGIVTGHGGHVTIDSELGVGTTVSIRLPATDGAILPAAAEPPPAGERLRVLVVDDETAIADVTREVLETEGHIVTAFTDSSVALEAIEVRASDFDVLLTDQTMPGVTGEQLARAARMSAPTIGIVIMSGYRLRFEDEGPDIVHLDKPFTSRRLLRALRQSVAPHGVAGPTAT